MFADPEIYPRRIRRDARRRSYGDHDSTSRSTRAQMLPHTPGAGTTARGTIPTSRAFRRNPAP